MSKWVHRLTDIDIQAMMATCACCGRVKIKKKSGGHVRCGKAFLLHKKKYDQTEKGKIANKKYRKSYDVKIYRHVCQKVCGRCGYECRHLSEMDVHHKDRNKKNNERSNLETLCACCHRLEHLPEDVKASLPPVSANPEPSVTKPTSPPSQGNLMTWEENKRQIRDLLEDVGKLSDEVESLKMDLEGARNLTPDERCAYWKSRCLKAEAYGAKNHGEFSQ